jgi:hypothetical protein
MPAAENNFAFIDSQNLYRGIENTAGEPAVFLREVYIRTKLYACRTHGD